MYLLSPEVLARLLELNHYQCAFQVIHVHEVRVNGSGHERTYTF